MCDSDCRDFRVLPKRNLLPRYLIDVRHFQQPTAFGVLSHAFHQRFESQTVVGLEVDSLEQQKNCQVNTEFVYRLLRNLHRRKLREQWKPNL